MSIKISSLSSGSPVAYAGRPASARAPSGAGEKVEPSATVSLSGVDAADGASPIDQARVDEIKAAIAAGRFSINPDAIADRLIQTAQELVNAQRRG
ncbi:MAG: flagellar biosynthesis anti-sigma factor FlgM [Zoogloeaceae bacterium]|nr:flagellar biosynthesis anti-sigma factor FlgM [Zoogloeaceae bacterium]